MEYVLLYLLHPLYICISLRSALSCETNRFEFKQSVTFGFQQLRTKKLEIVKKKTALEYI